MQNDGGGNMNSVFEPQNYNYDFVGKSEPTEFFDIESSTRKEA